MGLLAAFEVLATLANPYLAFVDEIGKLIAHFIGQKFQEGQAEDQLDFDTFLVLGLGQSALEQLGEKFAKAGMIRSARVAEIHAGKERGAGALADEIEKIVARGLNELRTQEYVVVNVIHADRQRPHGDRDVIALEIDPGRFARAG